MEVLDSESDQMSLFLRLQIFTRGDLLEQMPYPLSIFPTIKDASSDILIFCCQNGESCHSQCELITSHTSSVWLHPQHLVSIKPCPRIIWLSKAYVLVFRGAFNVTHRLLIKSRTTSRTDIDCRLEWMEAWSSVLWFVDITNALGIRAKGAPPTGRLVGDNMSTVTQYLECRCRSEVSSMAPSS